LIDFLISFREEFSDTVFIRGNHDQMLLDALIEDGVIIGHQLRDQSSVYRVCSSELDTEIFLLNGGKETLCSY
jgi:serine/threonine protein phosphatase 1